MILDKKLILVVFPFHFSNDKIQKYELEKFNEIGYDVIIHDLTEIIYIIQRPKTENNDNRILKFKDLNDWEKELKSIKTKNYAEIIIYNFLYPCADFNSGILFKKLKILNAKNIGFLNAGTFNVNYSSSFISFLHLRKIIHHVILNLKHYRTLLKLKKHGFIYYGFLVGSLSEYRNLYLSKLKLKTKIISGHCWDISNLYSKKYASNFEAKGFGVLLDGAGPKFENDEKYLNIKQTLTSEKWYPRLCLLFDYLESKFNINILIKGHYSVLHPVNPDYFGKREVFNDSLVELIKNSSVVMTRKSTALILAIYFKKPILIVTSNELRKNKSNKLYQNKISKYLECSLINIDDCHFLNKITKVKDKKRLNFLKYFGSFSNLETSNTLLIIEDLKK